MLPLPERLQCIVIEPLAAGKTSPPPAQQAMVNDTRARCPELLLMLINYFLLTASGATSVSVKGDTIIV